MFVVISSDLEGIRKFGEKNLNKNISAFFDSQQPFVHIITILHRPILLPLLTSNYRYPSQFLISNDISQNLYPPYSFFL
ncbi:unnamed protein product [Meloidogyne enterolobii]|uniref:Uncharacterized protein n=1 Tax=Meloidogyne enterolobii TaxID=390850 RepID=A0ACB1AZK9_MELEN